MIFVFLHCLTPPDTFIILIQVQKFKDAIILCIDSNKAPTQKVGALLLAFANAIFQCFEIIALPGCGTLLVLFHKSYIL